MLLTGWEAVNNFPGSNKFEISKINPLINDIEESVFRKCFSIALYNLMVADVKYNHLSPYPDWDKTVTYAINSYVFYQGFLYQLLGAATSLNQPPITNQAIWTLQAKFNNADYTNWWERYLKKYLSFMVMIPAVHYATVKAEPGGLMKTIDTNTGLANVGVKDLFDWKQQITIDADNILDNMRLWMKDSGLTIFSGILTINECENDRCGTNYTSYFYMDRKARPYHW